jgi:hypothetical protein
MLHEQKASAPNVIAARIVSNDVDASNPNREERNFGKTEVQRSILR